MIKIDINQDDMLKKITSLAVASEDVEVAWLYGSRANNTFSAHSDFDLAIAFRTFNLSPTDRFLRPNELAMEWGIKLDLSPEQLSIVDINQVPAYLAFNIVEFGYPLFADNTTRLFDEKSRIHSQYEFQMKESTDNA